MNAPVHAASATELAAWAGAPAWPQERSPFSADPFVLFDGPGLAALPAPMRRECARWLRAQPVPTIAVGEPPEAVLRNACDTLVEDLAQARPLIQAIRRSPIAASVFVQLLRATAELPLADALAMESLAYATLQSGPEFLAWLQSPERKRTPGGGAAPGGEPLILRREGATLELELNRPERRNAIDVTLRDALVEAFQLVEADESIQWLRVGARGRCFSIGGDLDEFGTVPDPATGHVIRSLSLPARFLARCAGRAEFHLHGACIGAGIELPAFAGRIVAAPDAFFQLPELRFGLIPGAGGCVSLPRRIGRHRTAQLVLGGRRLPAATALDWGLVDEIRPPGALHANG